MRVGVPLQPLAADTADTADGSCAHGPDPVPRSGVTRVGVRTAAAGLAVALVTLLCAACGSPTGGGAARVPGAGGKFAGYIRFGDLTSIGAHWVVPRILGGSEHGKASTWIGAVGGADGPDAPFIQVGTQEELDTSVTTTGTAPDPFYEAFWSDTAHHFHPVALFVTEPGDHITAHMRLVGHHWTLSITDEFTSLTATFTTPQEGGVSYNQAQWIQEDVTNEKTERAFPYPQLASAQMSALTINSRQPSSASLDSSWMQLPHGYIGPTPLVHDAFTFAPRRLSAAGARFLRIATPFNAAVGRFAQELEEWLNTRATPSVLTGPTDRFIRALSRSVKQLRGARWPADVSVAIQRLATLYADQVPRLRRAARVSAAAVIAVFPHDGADETELTDSHLIRRDLGVQETP